MVKGINLFKMSSSDPFTTVAILRTMAEIDPDHPIVRSMSAVYWRGGDDATERVLYRPQYFDKIVAWGGGDADQQCHQISWAGLPAGLVRSEDVDLDGRQAGLWVRRDARPGRGPGVADVMTLNQEACVSSRFLFVEGSEQEVDGFCAKLHKRIAERAAASGDFRPLDMELREQIETLMMMDDEFGVWGKPDGKGVVIRSDEPVDFHPINKTANVVRVDSLDDAVKYINVATQTVGFYPFDRMADYRDRLASGGAQRIVHLGEAGPSTIGNPHDAMYPMHRFVHWMAHEDGCEPQ
jgi:hypothetical protein